MTAQKPVFHQPDAIIPASADTSGRYTVQHLFVDREEYRKYIHDLYKGMYNQHNDDIKVIGFYGESGRGKSALLNQCEQELQNSVQGTIPVVHLSFEKKMDEIEILVNLRKQFKAALGSIDFHLFDCALMQWIVHSGNSSRVPLTDIDRLLTDDKVNSLRSYFSEILNDIPVEGSKSAIFDLPAAKSLITGLTNVAVEKLGPDKDTYKEINDPNITADYLRENLVSYLGKDLYRCRCGYHGITALIVMDACEKLANCHFFDDPDQSLIRNVPNSLWIFASREKITCAGQFLPEEQQTEVFNLEDQYIKEYFRDPEIGIENEELLDVLVNHTNGLPAYMALYAERYLQLKKQGKTADSLEELDVNVARIVEKWLLDLSRAQQNAMRILCLTPNTFSRTIIQNVCKQMKETFDESEFTDLMKSIMFTEIQNNNYQLEDTIRCTVREYYESAALDIIKAIIAFSESFEDDGVWIDDELEACEFASDIVHEQIKLYPDIEELRNLLGRASFNLGCEYQKRACIEEAQKLYEESLNIARKVTETITSTYHFDVADIYNNLAALLTDKGDATSLKEAKNLYEEALTVYRNLAKAMPVLFLPRVAMTGNNLANLLSNNSDATSLKEAKNLYEEALTVYRNLAETTSSVYLPDVAMTRNNLANLLSNNSDASSLKEAQKLYEDALTDYRNLAKAMPSAYLPYVAMICNNLAILLKNNGDLVSLKKAQKLYEESLEIRRHLAEAMPSAYLPCVAETCNNFANLLVTEGDLVSLKKAQKLYEESLEIRRPLAKAMPSAYLPCVAETCNNFANLLVTKGDLVSLKKAQKLYEESLEIRRPLAKAMPSVYLPGLAMTSNNLANLLHKINNPVSFTKALNLYKEALEIYRKLAETIPSAYLPYVAGTCNNLGNFLENKRNVASLEEVQELYEEALRIYRKLTEEMPTAYLPNVAGTCNNLAILLFVKGDEASLKDAQKLFEESLEDYRTLVEDRPSAYSVMLARTANSYALLLENLGDESSIKKAKQLKNEARRIKQ